ncbi:autotransporter domain-containing protein [Chitinibacteraceae bacterium HSL-7]
MVRHSLLALALLATTPWASAGVLTDARQRMYEIQGEQVKKRAEAVLSMMSFLAIPDLTSSTLAIDDKSTQKADLSLTQFGGGFTISRDTPLYLEGAAAYSRYDPTFVASGATETREVPLSWNSGALTGGIGWDFRLNDEWVIRPIFNFALGYMASDLALAEWWVNNQLDTDLAILSQQNITSGGLGGALMLDWERVREDYEYDMELRYSVLRIETIANDRHLGLGTTAATANLWTRYRAPTGLSLFSRPLRYVLELSHSEYVGDQRGVLGFDRLTSLGAGIEFDTSKYDIYVTRTRLVLRHNFGNNVSGWSLGLACSF